MAEDTPPDEKPAKRKTAPPESHRYRFTGEYPLIYLDRALQVEPGGVYEWPEGAPADGKWTKEEVEGN